MVKKKPWGYWCNPGFSHIPKHQKHKWRYGLPEDKKKYICNNCGMLRNKISNLSSKG